MVVTIFWMQSWISLMIAVVSLIILILFIFFCTCFDLTKKEKRFYVVEEKEPRTNHANQEIVTNSSYNLNTFSKFYGNTENESIFTSKNLPFCSLKKETFEAELVDSLESTKSFDNLILRFKETDASSMAKDELRSCASEESLNSFYSAHPSTIAKDNSRESFVSLISECEADNLII